MFSFILKYISLFCAISMATGLYFHIGETERKCFIEEIPDETMVVGVYKVEVFHKTSNSYILAVEGMGMHVEVMDEEEEVILSRMYASEGRFTFTSHSAGEHTICLYSNSTAWFGGGQLRVHLDIQVGEHANDYQQIAAKDKLSELQLRVRQLLDQVEQITKEQNYQRYREERFRQTSESTNQRVLWWSIAQTIILLITGFWQIRHLKGFFEAKKLVWTCDGGLSQDARGNVQRHYEIVVAETVARFQISVREKLPCLHIIAMKDVAYFLILIMEYLKPCLHFTIGIIRLLMYFLIWVLYQSFNYIEAEKYTREKHNRVIAILFFVQILNYFWLKLFLVSTFVVSKFRIASRNGLAPKGAKAFLEPMLT